MLMLLDLILTIVATLCALGLLLLGILLVLGKLPLRLSRRTRTQISHQISHLLGRPTSTVTPTDSAVTRDRPSTLPFSPQRWSGPANAMPPPTGWPAPTHLKSTFAADGIAPPEIPGVPNSTQTTDSQTNARLLIQLLKQLEGDVERRDRLIKYAKYRHPGQSDTWYLEKVVQDLDRDHRRKPGRGTPT